MATLMSRGEINVGRLLVISCLETTKKRLSFSILLEEPLQVGQYLNFE